MLTISRTLFFVFLLLLVPALHAQATESSITNQLKGLRAVPTAQRPAATIRIATDIRTLPAGLPKLKLADGLTHLSTEGDPGQETLQSVADTLSQALSESPLPAKGGEPAMPYMDLARLARYEHVSVDLKDPLFAKADEILAANDAEIERANFTLKDLHGKKITLSELRGKIVLVNFWATWCPPCRLEMPDLDAIYTHFQTQGLVVLSISDEDAFKVGSFINAAGYHPPVLLDPGGKVAKEFHVDGIPKSFVFDRDGKLVAQSIDMRTQHQFLVMLSKAGLHS
jgi:peroxiredoxin